MLDLFRVEVENQAQVLVSGLLALERDATSAAQLEACMRAAHSLKGAARIVNLAPGVDVAHAMEDCFCAAQRREVTLRKEDIDVLLRGVDLLSAIARSPEGDPAASGRHDEIESFLGAVATVTQGASLEGSVREAPAAPPAAAPPERDAVPSDAALRDGAERVLRVTAENLNRMLGMAGESRVGSRWLKPFADSLQRLRRMQHALGHSLAKLHASLDERALGEGAKDALASASRFAHECDQLLAQKLGEIESYESRATNLANRLYEEALASRMRPFADGMHSYPRMVRDVARSLGKEVQLEIAGQNTRIDRDILEKLDAPLGHLLRNAVDHGIESPAERRAAGKSAHGTIRLEARHSAGMLQVTIADDGRGIAPQRVAAAVVARGLASAEIAAGLSEAELMEFLFLPGFTMKDTVTDISGRGVGLDVVKNMLKDVRGTVQVTAQPGQGATFLMQLPLTLSVVRALLVEIGAEPYAFPLAHIVRTATVERQDIEYLEGRQHFTFDGKLVGLADANQVLDGGDAATAGSALSIVVVSDGKSSNYGLVVDRFLGESELVVHPLDKRLGKLKDVSAGALTEDGTPLLIVDVEDMIRSVEKLASGGRLKQVQRTERGTERQRVKRVLVVEDSLTVRELERKLIESRGYDVEVAVDGMDGWNAVRGGGFDLVVTDVDMPRMDGIELVGLIKREPSLKSLPVLIVSYKDREEDRRRGLDAGADYYLTKGSFQDESLVQAVADLIGEAHA
jgi:two-component system sensor histidine kinase and response regulator WspE